MVDRLSWPWLCKRQVVSFSRVHSFVCAGCICQLLLVVEVLLFRECLLSRVCQEANLWSSCVCFLVWLCWPCRTVQLRTRPTKVTSDGLGFRCINGNCSKRLTTRTIRAGSFFEKSRVPLTKWLYFLCLWCQDTMVKKAAETTGISERITLQVY